MYICSLYVRKCILCISLLPLWTPVSSPLYKLKLYVLSLCFLSTRRLFCKQSNNRIITGKENSIQRVFLALVFVFLKIEM